MWHLVVQQLATLGKNPQQACTGPTSCFRWSLYSTRSVVIACVTAVLAEIACSLDQPQGDRTSTETQARGGRCEELCHIMKFKYEKEQFFSFSRTGPPAACWSQ